MDRVVRVTVGLRPYRPQGFRVEAARLGAKLLIHNYGHGGAGMSLAWGTSHLAAELALGQAARTAAVLGAGVVGLTTARQLQRRGFAVTVYAKELPPYTTSNQSLANWSPTSGIVRRDARTEAFDASFRQAATIAYEELQQLVGRGYGVSWVPSYTLRRGPRGEHGAGVVGYNVRDLAPGMHPFPYEHVSLRDTLQIEPAPFLDGLLRDVRAAGGKVVVRGFERASDVAELDAPVVMNCMGLFGGRLFGDDSVIPVRGQLVVLRPQPEVTYGIGGMATPEGSFFYMTPRRDGIVLGGTSEPRESSLTPDPETTRRLVSTHAAMYRAWG